MPWSRRPSLGSGDDEIDPPDGHLSRVGLDLMPAVAAPYGEAYPLDLWQVSFALMQELPHAFPLLHSLQQLWAALAAGTGGA